jgi:sigma-54 specific flagellar transcriptional regulator A
MTSLDNKIIGQSKPAVELKKMIGLIATSSSPVIVNGPTGSGKELVAEAIHDESRRKGNFIALNCAAIPSELIEAELFGFEKGAFTGALKTTMGKFEQANRGTLFLDEIGDMPFGVQTKLLRVLENSIISKVGSSKEVKLDVRIICATHKNLEFLVEDNSFREDLLFRLNVFPISVPSLNERSDDIPDLLNHFLKLKTRVDNTKRPNFDHTAIEALKSYVWPGNIREVRNVVERSLIFFPNSKVNGDDVNKYLISVDSGVINRTEEQTEIWSEFDELGFEDPDDKERQTTSPPKPEDFAKWFETNNSVDLRALLRDIEIVFIETALDRNDGNTSEAAKDLKLLRTTLIEKVKKYSL